MIRVHFPILVFILERHVERRGSEGGVGAVAKGEGGEVELC